MIPVPGFISLQCELMLILKWYNAGLQQYIHVFLDNTIALPKAYPMPSCNSMYVLQTVP